MAEIETEAGRALRDDDRQHGSSCDPAKRRPDWCPCGQTENILAIEDEARADAAADHDARTAK